MMNIFKNTGKNIENFTEINNKNNQIEILEI